MEDKREIYDCATGQLTIEPLTAKEILERKKSQAIAENEALQLQEKLVRRNELLAKLGISDDEAKLLLS